MDLVFGEACIAFGNDDVVVRLRDETVTGGIAGDITPSLGEGRRHCGIVDRLCRAGVALDLNSSKLFGSRAGVTLCRDSIVTGLRDEIIAGGVSGDITPSLGAGRRHCGRVILLQVEDGFLQDICFEFRLPGVSQPVFITVQGAGIPFGLNSSKLFGSRAGVAFGHYRVVTRLRDETVAGGIAGDITLSSGAGGCRCRVVGSLCGTLR